MSITQEQEQAAIDLFEKSLPYYHLQTHEYPAFLKFQLFLNGYHSAWEACTDIANHWIATPKLKKKINRELTHTLAWKGIEPEVEK